MQELRDQCLHLMGGMPFSARLPRGEKDARILECARECVWEEGRLGDGETIARVLKKHAAVSPWTLGEMEWLQRALRLALVEKAADTAAKCAGDACDAARAMRIFARMQKGNTAPLPADRGVLAHLWRIAREHEAGALLARIGGALADMGLRGDGLARQQEENEFMLLQRMEGVLEALRQLQRLDTDGVAMQVLPVFAAFQQQPGFSDMDRDSRWHYARLAARLGREWDVCEWDVARAAVRLACGKDGAMGDCGYYLTESIGETAALLQVRRGELPVKRLCCTLGALLPGAVFGLLLLLRVPFLQAVCALLVLSEALRRAVPRLLRHVLLPSFAVRMKDMPEDSRVLAVLPAAVQGRRHALRLARKMWVLGKELTDRRIEFLLLLDLPPAPDRELPGDEEIWLAAREAAEMMNGAGEGARYHVLVRRRVWQEKRRLYGPWMEKEGAVRFVCGLVCGESDAEEVRSASFEPAFFAGRYTHVVLMDEGMRLTQSAVRKLVCAMEHPLHKGRTQWITPRLVRDRGLTQLKGALLLPFDGDGAGGRFGIADPRLFLEGQGQSLHAEDVVFFTDAPQDLTDHYAAVRRRAAQRLKDASSHFKNGKRKGMPLLCAGGRCLLSLWPLAGTGLLLFAAAGSAPWLCVLLLLMADGRGAMHLLLMPGEGLYAFLGMLDAATGRRQPQRREGLFAQPSDALFFSVGLGACTAALALAPRGFMPLAAAGVVWVLSPLWGAYLARPQAAQAAFPASDERLLRQLCLRTWHFFDASVTEKTHFLPPHFVQEQQGMPPASHVTPGDLGWYLVAVVSAREMGLIDGQDMGRRLNALLDSVEKMPMYRGLPYAEYALDTLQPQQNSIPAGECGAWYLCLLIAAQAARQHIREMQPFHRTAPGRLSALADRMQLRLLADEKNGGFFEAVTKDGEGTGQLVHAGQKVLLGFAAALRGVDTEAFFDGLSGDMVRAGGGAALRSRYGGMQEYTLPSLLLPLFPRTLLRQSERSAVRAQIGYVERRPWGLDDSASGDTDAQLHYREVKCGVPYLSRDGQSPHHVTAPYAALLALNAAPRASVHNLKRMIRLGFMGEMGLFDGADYAPGRVEISPRIARVYNASHQGMVLGAVCNALKNQALPRYLLRFARAEGKLSLLCRSAVRSLPMRPYLRPAKEKSREVFDAAWEAASGAAAAWMLGFHGRCMVVNDRGSGVIRTGGTPWNPFTGAADLQEGLRVYVRAGEGRLFQPALGMCAFHAGSVTYTREAGGVRVQETRGMDPATGAVVLLEEMQNLSDGALDADVTVYFPVHHHVAAIRSDPDERVLALCGEGKTCMALMALGNGARLHKCSSRAAFFGAGGELRPDFAWGEDGPVQQGAAHDCLAVRLRVPLPAGGKAACAFVLCMEEFSVQETLQSLGSVEKARHALSLSRRCALLRMQALNMDVFRQMLLGRLLGGAFFCHQPHQQGKAGDRPLIAAVMDGECDRVLIRHLVRFGRWMESMQTDVQSVIILPPGDHRLKDEVVCSLHTLGAGDNLSVRCLPAREREALLGCSRLILRGGETLLSQLDALAALPRADADGMPVALPDASLATGFDGEGGFCIARGQRMHGTYVLCGDSLATCASPYGIGESYAAGDECIAGGADEELLFQWDGASLRLTAGDAILSPGEIAYPSPVGGGKIVLHAFAHPTLPLSLRTVKLQAGDQPFCGTLEWRVRFSPGGSERGTALEDTGGAVIARHGDRSFIAFAHCDQAQAQWNTAAPRAQVLCPVQLSAHGRLQVTYVLGAAGKNLPPPFAALPGGTDALRDTRRYWQQVCNILTVYTMDPWVDHLASRYIPFYLRGLERKMLSLDADACLDACALCDREPERVEKILARYAQSREEDRSLACVMAGLVALHAHRRAKSPDPNAVRHCMTLLMQGDDRLPCSLQRALALRALMPYLEEEMAAQAQSEVRGILAAAEKLRQGELYGSGDDKAVQVQSLACLAGVPVRHGRQAVYRAYCLAYDEEGETLLLDVRTHVKSYALLILALCRMEEGRRAWTLMRSVMHALVQTCGVLLCPGAGFLWHVLIRHVLGYDRQGEKVTLSPVRGMDEKEMTLELTEGDRLYRLTADSRRTDVLVDGRRQTEKDACLPDDAGVHEIRFPMWKV